jgi:hypothetical protein
MAFGVAADAAQASGSGAHSMLCGETANPGQIEALLMATTLLRSWARGDCSCEWFDYRRK